MQPHKQKLSTQGGSRLAGNQKGFGLIEVIVTLFLITVTLLLFQATANSIILNKYSRYREIALRIADQKLQDLRTTPYAELPSTGSFADPQLSSLPNGQAAITVADLNTRLKDVTVTVTWNNPNGSGTQRIRLQTYIDQGGLGK